jgi:hypothetical protein
MLRFTCQYCDAAVTQDAEGAWLDATDGDCCSGNPETGENENEAHEGTLPVGTRVYWNDPDRSVASGWGTVASVHGDIISVSKDDGGEAEVYAHELTDDGPDDDLCDECGQGPDGAESPNHQESCSLHPSATDDAGGEPRMFVVDFGNSTNGAVGCVLRLLATSRADALEQAKVHLPEAISEPLSGSHGAMDLRVYLNVEALTLANVRREED